MVVAVVDDVVTGTVDVVLSGRVVDVVVVLVVVVLVVVVLVVVVVVSGVAAIVNASGGTIDHSASSIFHASIMHAQPPCSYCHALTG